MSAAMDAFQMGMQGGANSGIGGFIRTKLNEAREKNLVSHQYSEMGRTNIAAAQAAAQAAGQAKTAAQAPLDQFNMGMIDQLAPIDPATGQRDWSKLTQPQYTDKGDPYSIRTSDVGGRLLPQVYIGRPEDAVSARIRQMGGDWGQSPELPESDDWFAKDRSELDAARKRGSPKDQQAQNMEIDERTAAQIAEALTTLLNK